MVTLRAIRTLAAREPLPDSIEVVVIGNSPLEAPPDPQRWVKVPVEHRLRVERFLAFLRGGEILRRGWVSKSPKEAWGPPDRALHSESPAEAAGGDGCSSRLQ